MYAATGGSMVAVFHSKSLFLESLRVKGLEKGFRVFEAKEHNEEAEKELEQIYSLDEKVLVTIEEYQDWLAEIQRFKYKTHPKSVLVLTARNSINDVVIDSLAKQMKTNTIPEIRLDTLRDDEIYWFIDVLDEYGLWGKHAGSSQQEKYEFIRWTCQGQIHALLLKLLDSPDIGIRLQNLSRPLADHKEKYEVLLGICVLTLINQHPTLDILVDIFGVEALGSGFRKDPVVREFIDFSLGDIKVKSSIAAQYLLTRVSDASYVISLLSKMANRVHKAAIVSKRYQSMFRNLMRFSNLQMVLPTQGRKAAVISYYESIKNLDNCKTNPLFWLQYAIASIVIEDLFHSKKYFEAAYSYAEVADFDTFQIDNHYSRFLLVEASQNLMDPVSAMGNFRKAREMIHRQMTGEKLYYPYRVASNYLPFILRQRSQLSIEELREINIATNDVRMMIRQLPRERSSHRDVVKCDRNMQQAIEIIQREVKRREV